MVTEIKINNKQLISRNVCYNIEIEINNKKIVIVVIENYNLSSDTIEVDYDIVDKEQTELTEQENDDIHDWVYEFKYKN